mgnify:CR=1 FL=1
MKISESQKEAWRKKAEAKAEQEEQNHLIWLKNQNFLSKDNREYLVNELTELQEEETRLWSYIHRDSDKKIPNWKHHKDKMYFQIDMINLKIEKIKEVLINNKFR